MNRNELFMQVLAYPIHPLDAPKTGVDSLCLRQAAGIYMAVSNHLAIQWMVNSIRLMSVAPIAISAAICNFL